MDIGVRLIRNIVIEDEVHGIDVQPPGRHVRRYQYADGAVLELFDDLFPLVLCHVAVYRSRLVAIGLQLLCQAVSPVFGVAEHYGLGLAIVKYGGQRIVLGVPLDHEEILRGKVQDRFVPRDQQLLGIDHLVHRQLPYVLRHGGGEQHGLPLPRHLGQDIAEVPGEAHVQHPVRLI